MARPFRFHARAAIARSLLVLLLAGACGGLTPVPSRGGPTWYELRSEHFVLRTDLAQPRAIETLQLLEQLLHAYLLLGWKAQGWPERLAIVVMRNPDDVHHFIPSWDGAYLPGGKVWPRLALAPWREGPTGLASLKHELTHHIAHAAIPNHPAWFAEGTAKFFETASFDRRGRFVVGSYDPDMAWFGAMPSAQLLSERADRQDSRFYPNAWLLVHYLITRRPQEFRKYERALAAGTAFDEAWSDAFADLDHATLDGALERYLRSGPFRNAAYSFARRSAPVTVRALSDAEVYALRSRLYFQCRPGDDWAALGRANIALALERDPAHAAQALAPLVTALARMRGANGEDRRAACELATGLMALNGDGQQRAIAADAHAAHCWSSARAGQVR